MNMRYLYILPIFSFFLGIGGYQLYNSLFEEEEQTIRTAVSYDEIARLEENIVKNGDIDSYNQLMSYMPMVQLYKTLLRFVHEVYLTLCW